MDTNPSRDAELIPAAGGLVWRDSPQGKVLAVVHRLRHGGDWTLPKGKLKEGESWLAAARREVKEETGCQVRVESFAGSICYHADGKPKVVRFWNMSVVGEPGEPTDKEVDKVDWLPVEGACARLTYPLERALIESAQLAPAVPR